MNTWASRTWDLDLPTRVLWRPEGLGALGDFLQSERAVLLTSPSFTRSGVTEIVRRALGPRLVGVFDEVKPNPDIEDMDRIAKALRPMAPGAIVALGGGSTIDAAKAMSQLLTLPEDTSLAQSFRTCGGLGLSTTLELVAVPTTAGTGAEVTPFATMWDFREGKKYSLAGTGIAPTVALMDWTLTRSLPHSQTVATGLDAVSHALESFWSRSMTPVSSAFSIRSLQLALPAMAALARGEYDDRCRAAMMEGSLLAGLAISQTRTALAHALSYGFTTSHELPHGIACSFTLPQVLRFNAEADDGRFGGLTQGLGFSSVESLAATIQSLLVALGVGEVLKTRNVCLPPVSGSDPKSAGGAQRAGNNLRVAEAKDSSKILRDAFLALGVAT